VGFYGFFLTTHPPNKTQWEHQFQCQLYTPIENNRYIFRDIIAKNKFTYHSQISQYYSEHFTNFNII
jgi:hypothetical protein